jgi:3-hydroxyacyl-CoA dehydrogenase
MRASDVRTVAVVGAGTMGAGIAGLVARRDRVLLALLEALERDTDSGEESHG